MSQQFRRAWLVTVGTGGTTALQTSLLDVKFKITRSLRPRAGKCELEIYNCNDTHRAQLLAVRQPFVQVAAGYVGNVPMLFTGNGRKAFAVREETSWTLRITAGDGEASLRGQRVVASFGPGTGLTQVVRAIAAAMDVGLGNAVTAIQGASFASGVGNTFPEGTVLQGRATDELDRLCASADLEWSIQDGNLQILPLGGALQRQAVLLADDAGLIGSPEAGKGALVKCRALIQPGLEPGSQVQIRSSGINGLYRVEKTEYEGDSTASAQDWYANLTCRAVRS